MTATTSTTALGRALATAAADNRAALVGYLPAGFPTVKDSIAALQAMVEGGCDVIEVGLPYSDPVMDGPAVQRGAEAALAAGFRVDDLFTVVREVADTGAAALVMTYWNPIERRGVERFAADLAEASGAGLITPDLVPDEAGDWIAASDAHQLDRVFLVAPSSTDERLDMTARACRGFIYAASVMGVTGTRASVGSAARGLVERTRAVTDTPVCVGLGVSTGAQAGEIAAYADGVIVGSAFVNCLLNAPDTASGIAAARDLAAELAAGARRSA